jgi:hypothetical protein
VRLPGDRHLHYLGGRGLVQINVAHPIAVGI